MFDTSPQLDCAGRILRLDRARVMGIVNVTPDSFSDGGAHDTTEAAVAHGLKLVEEGADLLDIGGESTRPGAAPVSVEEELRRVIPVIEQLAPAPGADQHRHLQAGGDARGRGRWRRHDQRHLRPAPGRGAGRRR
jgi:hypothetical protein